MIPQLTPIKLPALKKLWMSDKNICRPESWVACMMVFSALEHNAIGQLFLIDDEQTIWIWEASQDRLWLLGHDHCSVNYFSFETGHPFLYRSESLLKKSRTESFDYSAVQFHLSVGVDYWIPPSNDVLDDKGGLPLLVWEMEKKKLLPAASRKFIRSFYQQLQFASLGFKEPERTRTELLSLLVQTTCETTIATAQKIHPEIWKSVCVEGEVKHSEAKLYKTEDTVKNEENLVNEINEVALPFQGFGGLTGIKHPYHETPKETKPSLSQESKTKS